MATAHKDTQVSDQISIGPRRYGRSMETRRLGRTEHWSSVAILGGAAFWDASPEATKGIVEMALGAGVNHVDVAPQYGRAEELLGPQIALHREELFVACKTLRHNAKGVRAQLENSLERLHCDAVDLYQLHAVTDMDELNRREDAVEVLLQARDEGLCRFIGITGHGLTTPKTQLEALRRYDFDTVMLPINPRLFGEPDYERDVEALLEEVRTRDVGVMAIKAATARPWGDRTPTATTWYEPYRTVAELTRGIGFALSTPGVTGFCMPGDIELVPNVLEAAGRSVPWSDEERAQAVEDVRSEPPLFVHAS